MYTSLLHIANFIRSRKVVKDKTIDVLELKEFGKAVQNFVFFIYKSKWNLLPTDKYNNLFKTKILNKFILKVLKNNLDSTLGKYKVAKIVKLSPPISVCLPKEVLEKSKFFSKENNTMAKTKMNTKQSYA